jgi:hypothetical protein
MTRQNLSFHLLHHFSHCDIETKMNLSRGRDRTFRLCTSEENKGIKFFQGMSFHDTLHLSITGFRVKNLAKMELRAESSLRQYQNLRISPNKMRCPSRICQNTCEACASVPANMCFNPSIPSRAPGYYAKKCNVVSVL